MFYFVSVAIVHSRVN